MFSLIFTSPNYFMLSTTSSSFINDNDTDIENIDIDDHIEKVSINKYDTSLKLSQLHQKQIIGISATAADSEDCEDFDIKDGSRLAWAEWRDDPTFVNVSDTLYPHVDNNPL